MAHQEVFGYARVGFTRIKKVMPESLVLECRPKFRIDVQREGGIEEAIKRAEEVNKPFNKSISFVDGKLKTD